MPFMGHLFAMEGEGAGPRRREAAPFPLPEKAAAGLLPGLPPEEVDFVLFCMEGPDPYSRAGGLGARVTELSRALAEAGYRTHLLFVGDPAFPEQEEALPGRLWLHRQCNWLSRYYPDGVYHGEDAKLAEFRARAPRHALEQIIRPALEEDRRVVVLAEEWQMTAPACDLSDLLHEAGLRDRVLILWNANSGFGFERIDWPRLRASVTLTTVSHWMKHLMWGWGANPITIPNGIPGRLLELAPAAERAAARLRERLGDRPLLVKVARFDPDKRWPVAVEALAGLRKTGLPALLVARGDGEQHGAEVLRQAEALGLRVAPVEADGEDVDGALEALAAAAREVDLLDLRFFLTPPLLQALYRAADGVLANSGREPFGLVGLEAMAAGGIVFTGATGEEYARPFDNGIVLETDDPREIEAALLDLLAHPEQVERMRAAARETAARHTWENVLPLLLRRLRLLAMGQGWT